MNIVDALRQLGPTGSDSFEELIAELLSALTGQYFRRARPGSQMGRDMNTREGTANVIAVECKRYGKNTVLDTRELMGEILQLRVKMPDADAWVLVTSRAVDAQLFEELREGAERLDLEFICINPEDGKPSSLEVLCAQAPTITMGYLTPLLPYAELNTLARSLTKIASSRDFPAMCEKLRTHLQSPLIGFASWRTTQNNWFQNHLRSEMVSREAFKQVLNVADSATKLVERKALWGALDKWLVEWSTQRTPFIALGEEGDGKTWGIASWLNRKLEKDPLFPPVMFMASLDVNSNIPQELIVTNTTPQAQIYSTNNWQSRIIRWLTRQSTAAPAAILVLDGINERRAYDWWRQLLESLVGDQTFENVALIITCRTGYWQRTIGKLRTIPAIEFILQPFNEKELRQALESNSVKQSEIPPSLFELIRKPRYFDLTLRHQDRLEQTGDLTPARLIYEDWLDRQKRKTGVPITDEEFRNLLRGLAEKYISGSNVIRGPDLMALVPRPLDHQNLWEELRTGGVLKGNEGRYKVDEQQLPFGLGLLLVDKLLDAFEADPDSDLSEIAASWLEPNAGMDIKARICEMAAVHALQIGDVPRQVKLTLLSLWLDSQNPGQEIESTLTAYLPLDPDCYIQLCELVWTDSQENRWAQELLMHAFLRWYPLSPPVATTLAIAFERWLGFVHRLGYPLQRGVNSEKGEEVRCEICARLGYELMLGEFVFAGRKFTAISDDGLLRLGRVALAVISYLPRGSFIPSISTLCVAEAIMGRSETYELLRWIFSTSPASVWSEVSSEVQKLLKFDSVITTKAAYRLLSFEGSKQAYEFRQNLPQNLFPQSPIILEILNNPCTSGFSWSRSDCEECLRRDGLEAQYIARQIKSHCVDPTLNLPPDLGTQLATLTKGISVSRIWSTFGTGEDDHALDSYEPALCHYAPDAIADLVRNIVRRTHERQGFALRQISFKLCEHSLLLEQNETQSIYEAWAQLNQLAEPWHEEQETAEMFLFGIALQNLDAAAQIEHLLKRPENASDLLNYKSFFLPVENWSKVEDLLNQTTNIRNLCRVLWFISANPENVPTRLLNEYIVPLLDTDNSVVRSTALEIIYKSRNAEVAGYVTQFWAWHADRHEHENHWGSLILCEYGQAFGLSELSRRIHPAYWGYGVSHRGMGEHEVNLLAEEIHEVWKRLSVIAGSESLPEFPPISIYVDTEKSSEVSTQNMRGLSNDHGSRRLHLRSRYNSWGGGGNEILADWQLSLNQQASEKEAHDREIVSKVIQQQIDADNFWFARRFYMDSLAEVVAHRPDLLEQWLDILTKDSAAVDRLLVLAHSFYESLCMILLQRSPGRGVFLHSKLENSHIFSLDNRSHRRLLDMALFNAPFGHNVADIWAKKLCTSRTDLDLLHFVSMAQKGTAKEWLWLYIDKSYASEAPIERALAITLLGFYDDNTALERLNALSEIVPDTWIGELVQTSLERWKTNNWAKYWFRQVFTAERTEVAWAAFRLFLTCADSRFWIWWKEVQDECANYTDFERRWQFVENNLETIRKRVRKNGERFEKYLYGQKVLHNQVWPWL